MNDFFKHICSTSDSVDASLPSECFDDALTCSWCNLIVGKIKNIVNAIVELVDSI